MPSFPKARRSAYYHKREPHEGRTSKNRKFYDSAAWRRTRLIHISNNPFCVQCMDKGLYVDCTGRSGVVDHIVPINEGGAKLSPTNLQTLCNECHNVKSGKEAHKR